MRRVPLCSCLALLALCVQPVWGVFLPPTSITQNLLASGTSNGTVQDSDTQHSTAPYSQTRQVHPRGQFWNMDLEKYVTAYADCYTGLSSTLAPQRLQTSGYADAYASAPEFAHANCSGNSTLTLVFTLPAPGQFSVSGNVTAAIYSWMGGDTARATVKLIGPGNTTIFNYDMIGQDPMYFPPTRIDFNTSGLLAAGQYTLTAEALGSAYAGGENPPTHGDSSFSVDLTVTPEPATAALLLLGGVLALRRRVR